MKLLFHACCAPCSVECIRQLRGEGLEPDLFWHNPNIHPFTEYNARKDCLAAFAKEENLRLVMDDNLKTAGYGLRAFIAGMPDDKAPERCAFCYRLRLEKTAQRAKEDGYDAFSSSLLISPYQNHELLKETGGFFAAKHGIEFLYRDFRPYFREGQKTARERGCYMQKYCGCIFSEEERYTNQRKQG